MLAPLLQGIASTHGMDPRVKRKGLAVDFESDSWLIAFNTSIRVSTEWDQLVQLACRDAVTALQRRATAKSSQAMADGPSEDQRDCFDDELELVPNEPLECLQTALQLTACSLLERYALAAECGGTHPVTRGRR